jgi:hypothetical protein
VPGRGREGNGVEKKDGAAADGFSSGLVAWGREGKGGGGPYVRDHMEREDEGRGGLVLWSAAQGGQQRPPVVGCGRQRCRENMVGGGRGRRGAGG